MLRGYRYNSVCSCCLQLSVETNSDLSLFNMLVISCHHVVAIVEINRLQQKKIPFDFCWYLRCPLELSNNFILLQEYKSTKICQVSCGYLNIRQGYLILNTKILAVLTFKNVGSYYNDLCKWDEMHIQNMQEHDFGATWII